MIDQFIRSVARLSRLTGWIAAGMIVLSVLVVCQMVFVRYALRGSVIWQTEFVTYLLIASTIIGSPYVLLIKGHVNVDLLPSYLGPKARFALAIVSSLFAMLFCAVAAWSTYSEWHQAWVNDWLSDTVWAVRMWIPLLAMPVGFSLVLLQYVADLLALLTGRPMPFTDLEVTQT
jgi:TRAP-type C4-dicarboxylate transport system permease small subunit